MTKPRKRKAPNLLDQKQATVTLHRNGLQIEIGSIPAVDAANVAAAMLDAFRDLTAKYEELVVDAGSVHGQLVETPEEYDEPDGSDPPSAKPKRRMGFH